MHHKQFFDQEGTLLEYKMLGAMYVQALVNGLNKRFLDLHVFNTLKNFSSKYYPSDEAVCLTMYEQWLERLIKIFGLMAVEGHASRAKLLEFVENLRHECETNHCMRHGHLVGAQQPVHQLATSHETLAEKKKKKKLVIPSSIAICEKRSSK